MGKCSVAALWRTFPVATPMVSSFSPAFSPVNVLLRMFTRPPGEISNAESLNPEFQELPRQSDTPGGCASLAQACMASSRRCKSRTILFATLTPGPGQHGLRRGSQWLLPPFSSTCTLSPGCSPADVPHTRCAKLRVRIALGSAASSPAASCSVM